MLSFSHIFTSNCFIDSFGVRCPWIEVNIFHILMVDVNFCSFYCLNLGNSCLSIFSMLSFLFLRVAVVFHLRYVKYIFSFNLLFVFFRNHRAPFSVYKDTNVDITSCHQPDNSKTECNSWLTLGAQAERNKENNAKPAKWTSCKVLLIPKTHIFFFLALARIWKRHLTHLSSHFFQIPQRPGPGVGGATTSDHIEVFIDEECAEWVIRLISSVRLFTIITHFISHGHMHSDSDDHLNSSVESSSSQSYNEIDWIRRFSSICS